MFLFLWGVAVLTLRVGGLHDSKTLAYGLLGLLAVPPLAWLLAQRRIPNDRQLGAILDRDNEVGGILMSSFETDIGPWSERMDDLKIPTLHWESRQVLGLGLLAVCFAATALLLPINAISGPQRQRLNVDDQIKKLTTQLETLKEEKLLDVEEIEARKLELEKIKNQADGAGPVKTFDALDHLAERMNQKAVEAAENAKKTTETLTKIETLTQSVKDVLQESDEATAKSLMEGLAQSLEEMLADNEQLRKDLKDKLDRQTGKKDDGKKKAGKNDEDDENAENGENGEKKGDKNDALKEALKKMLEENNFPNLSPEQLDQLSQAMRQCQGDCERMCENLQEGGFAMDPELLKQLSELKQLDKEEAERILSDLWENCDSCNGDKDSNGEKRQRSKSNKSPRFTQQQDWTTDPDQVDDTRFEKDPDEEGAEFHAKFLPPADLEAFRNSQKIGASVAAPEKSKGGSGVDHGGALRQTEGGLGSAHGQTIYPQHRGAVGRYFDE